MVMKQRYIPRDIAKYEITNIRKASLWSKIMHGNKLITYHYLGYVINKDP